MKGTRVSADSECRPVWLLIAVAVIALIAAGLVLVSTSRYGVGLTPDSVSYIAAAEHVAEGKGFLQYDSEPFVDWPPLYPSLLALARTSGIDPRSAARLLNMVALALLVFGSGIWVLRKTRSSWCALLSAVFFLFSFELALISRMAWTELLFSLLILSFLIGFERYFASRSLVRFLLVALIAALACATRYMGVTLVLTGVAFLLMDREVPLRTRIRSSVVFAVLALLPLFLWCLRNLAVSSTWVGVREPSTVPLYMNVVQAIAHVSYWMVPYGFPKIPRAIAGSLVLLVLGVCVLRAMFFDRRGIGSRGLEAKRLLLFILTYVVVLIVAASTAAVDKVAGRLLSPIHVPFFVLVFESIGTRVRSAGTLKSWGTLATAVLGAWLVLAGLTYAQCVPGHVKYGVGGYAVKRWHTSALLSHLRAHPPAGLIFSNCPQAVYILSGHYARYSPRTYPYPPWEEIREDLEAVRKRLESETAILAWFKADHGAHLLNIADLERRFEMEVVEEFDDGVLYRLLSVRNAMESGSPDVQIERPSDAAAPNGP